MSGQFSECPSRSNSSFEWVTAAHLQPGKSGGKKFGDLWSSLRITLLERLLQKPWLQKLTNLKYGRNFIISGLKALLKCPFAYLTPSFQWRIRALISPLASFRFTGLLSSSKSFIRVSRRCCLISSTGIDHLLGNSGIISMVEFYKKNICFARRITWTVK